MRRILRYSLTAFMLALACGVCMAQTDRKEVRAGNRQYKKGNWQNAEIEYRGIALVFFVLEMLVGDRRARRHLFEGKR